MPLSRPSVLVVGGGLSGLTAAYQFREEFPGCEVTIVEAERGLGGKLDTADFPSGPVELGAEAFVGRRPEAATLVAELGLTQELRHPSPLAPAILSGGVLHPMPVGTVMGLPSNGNALAGVLSPEDVRTASAEAELPLVWNPGSDVGVGRIVAERFGRAVVDRLVDPLLGGVYAAPSAGLGLREVVPGVAEMLDAGAPSLTAAVRTLVSRRVPGPVFASIAGGYRTLVAALTDAARARILTGTRCTSLRRSSRGVEAVLTRADGSRTVVSDAVVLAVPVPDAVRLLRPRAPEAAGALSGIRTASSALVVLEVDRGLALPEHSGVLVASDEPVEFKAITFSGNKWPHLDSRPGHLVRVSFGKLGSDEVVRRGDAELATAASSALAGVCGSEPRVLHSRVRRWIDGLPEIGPGHTELLSCVRESLARELEGVELVGAATEGVGVPACIGSARAAARRLAARWQD